MGSASLKRPSVKKNSRPGSAPSKLRAPRQVKTKRFQEGVKAVVKKIKQKHNIKAVVEVYDGKSVEAQMLKPALNDDFPWSGIDGDKVMVLSIPNTKDSKRSNMPYLGHKLKGLGFWQAESVFDSLKSWIMNGGTFTPHSIGFPLFKNSERYFICMTTETSGKVKVGLYYADAGEQDWENTLVFDKKRPIQLQTYFGVTKNNYSCPKNHLNRYRYSSCPINNLLNEIQYFISTTVASYYPPRLPLSYLFFSTKKNYIKIDWGYTYKDARKAGYSNMLRDLLQLFAFDKKITMIGTEAVRWGSQFASSSCKFHVMPEASVHTKIDWRKVPNETKKKLGIPASMRMSRSVTTPGRERQNKLAKLSQKALLRNRIIREHTNKNTGKCSLPESQLRLVTNYCENAVENSVKARKLLKENNIPCSYRLQRYQPSIKNLEIIKENAKRAGVPYTSFFGNGANLTYLNMANPAKNKKNICTANNLVTAARRITDQKTRNIIKKYTN